MLDSNKGESEMTDVVQNLEIDPKADLSEILRVLSESNGSKPEAKARKSLSKRSNPVEVSSAALAALSTLSGLLEAVKVPSGRRLTTPAEREEMMDLATAAKTAQKGVEAAVDAVKEAVFNHLDVLVERYGSTDDLKKDENGHYLVKGELFVDTREKRFTRELREQKPNVTAADLRDMWQAGEISRQDYMDATKHVEVPREIVEDKLADLLKRKPELLSKIAKILVPGKVSAAFYVRDLKLP